MNKKVILAILDGWGLPKQGEEWRSAIEKANVPYFRYLAKTYPNSKLQASGQAVGLPEGQMGNSEVGHMNLGAGRIVFQELEKINMAVRNGNLAAEPTVLAAIDYTEKSKKDVHLIGLCSDGGVHSHIFHLKGLIDIFNKKEIENVFVHAFLDGRDTDPQSGKVFIEDLMAYSEGKNSKIASLIGRYYAMDRDKRWDRVRLAYDAMVRGVGENYVKSDEILKAVQDSYNEEVTDEFLKPIIVVDEQSKPIGQIKEGDVVLCFNFRTDRGREITQALTQQDFPEHDMKRLNLYYITMTNYDDSFKDVKVIYEKENLSHTLGEVLEANGKTQIRIAETEKYPHVTFFFSGGREEPFENEIRLLSPSPKDVPTYDFKPEMAAEHIKDSLLPYLKEGKADFVCLNFANPDMVGHTGVFEAVVKAVETVDLCLKEVVETGLAHGYTTLVIADHGNAEYMINDDKSVNTAHSTNLVPFIVVDPEYKGQPKDGKLGDLGPTILEILKIEKPEEMTGENLL